MSAIDASPESDVAVAEPEPVMTVIPSEVPADATAEAQSDPATAKDEGDREDLRATSERVEGDTARQVVLPEIGQPAGTLDLPGQIEAVLFVADGPVSIGELGRALDVDRRKVLPALDELAERCSGCGLRLQRLEDDVQLATAPEAAEAVQRFLGLEHTRPLSRAALETLSIIAYRQPLTRPEIDELRGVNSDGVLRTLLGRELVQVVGERETVGHPIEYGTTFQFLSYFGISSLEELPAIDDFPLDDPLDDGTGPDGDAAAVAEDADALSGDVRRTGGDP